MKIKYSGIYLMTSSKLGISKIIDFFKSSINLHTTWKVSVKWNKTQA